MGGGNSFRLVVGRPRGHANFIVFVGPAFITVVLFVVGLTQFDSLVGSLLPMLVAGSVVVETVFSLEGLGRLAYVSVMGQDQAMVMALTAQ